MNSELDISQASNSSRLDMRSKISRGLSMTRKLRSMPSALTSPVYKARMRSERPQEKVIGRAGMGWHLLWRMFEAGAQLITRSPKHLSGRHGRADAASGATAML